MEDEVKTVNKNHVWLKLLLLLLIIGSVAFLLYHFDMHRLFFSKRRLTGFIHSLGAWGFIGLIVLQALQVVVSPIPGEATGLLGGYLYGPYLGVLLSTIGLTLGSYLAFILSRALGRPFVKKFVPQSVLQRFDYLLHHKGAFLVFMLFLIPGFPKDYLCYILGLGSLTTKEFLLIGGTGRLFGTILLSLGGNFIRLHQYIRFSVLVLVALVILFWTLANRVKLERRFRLWHLKSRRKRNSQVAEKAVTSSRL
ncbi:MAG: TVP38/TMEM64 family protein [Syntrophobacteraceae bacterium]